MVGVFAEESFGGLEAVLADPTDPECFAPIDDLQKAQGGKAAGAGLGQSAGLVNDVIGENEPGAGLEQRSDSSFSGGVSGVAMIRQRVKSGGVDENVTRHRPRDRSRRWTEFRRGR